MSIEKIKQKLSQARNATQTISDLAVGQKSRLENNSESISLEAQHERLTSIVKRFRAHTAGTGHKSAATLETLCDAAFGFASQNLENSTNLRLPLSSQQLERQKLLIIALELICNECSAQREIKSELSSEKVRELFEKEVEALDATLMVSNLFLTEVPAGFWKRTNNLVEDISVHGFFDTPERFTRFFVDDAKAKSLRERYLLMIMVSLARPNQLGPGDIMRVREIAKIHEKKIRLIGSANAADVSGDRALMMIDPLADVAAMPISGFRNLSLQDGTKLLDTTDLVSRLSAALECHRNKMASDDTFLDSQPRQQISVLLKQLVVNWGKAPIRQKQRTRSNLPARFICGFGTTYEHINSIQAQIEASETPLSFDEIDEATAQALPATIVDHSETGIRASFKCTQTHLAVGDIITVLLESDTGVRIKPYIVRWITVVENETLEIGALKIGDNVFAAKVTPFGSSHCAQDAKQTLVLNSTPSVNSDNAILVTGVHRMDTTTSYSGRVGQYALSVESMVPLLETCALRSYRCKIAFSGDYRRQYEHESDGRQVPIQRV